MAQSRRRTNADRIAAALQGLEDAEKALVSMDETRLSHSGRAALGRLRRAIKDGKSAAADSLEDSLGGALVRSRPAEPSPLFSDQEGA